MAKWIHWTKVSINTDQIEYITPGTGDEIVLHFGVGPVDARTLTFGGDIAREILKFLGREKPFEK